MGRFHICLSMHNFYSSSIFLFEKLLNPIEILTKLELEYEFETEIVNSQ